jgi:mannosyl-oligosaccharide alpha-1,3-glucosidase
MVFPDDSQGFGMDDQFYLGDTGILVHPVTKKDADSVDIYIGETEVFPCYFYLTVDLLLLL